MLQRRDIVIPTKTHLDPSEGRTKKDIQEIMRDLLQYDVEAG